MRAEKTSDRMKAYFCSSYTENVKPAHENINNISHISLELFSTVKFNRILFYPHRFHCKCRYL